MNLIFALPSLNWNEPYPPPLPNTPALNQLLRFGRFEAQALPLSQLYARCLWQGSLCRQLLQQQSLPTDTPAILVSPLWQQMGLNQTFTQAGNALQIQTAEAEQWCAGLTDFYRDDGWQFHVCRPDLWLLTLPEAPAWQVPPVFDIIGQIDGTLRAEGAAEHSWLSRQTEIQMWLHSHPLNSARNANGLPPVNALWLWPDLPGSRTSPFTAGDSPWLTPAQAEQHTAPANLDALLAAAGSASSGLLFLEHMLPARDGADAHAYAAIVADWETNWFAPAWQYLKSGRLSQLDILTDGSQGGCLSIRAKAHYAFWRSRQVFNGHLR